MPSSILYFLPGDEIPFTTKAVEVNSIVLSGSISLSVELASEIHRSII